MNDSKSRVSKCVRCSWRTMDEVRLRAIPPRPASHNDFYLLPVFLASNLINQIEQSFAACESNPSQYVEALSSPTLSSHSPDQPPLCVPTIPLVYSAKANKSAKSSLQHIADLDLPSSSVILTVEPPFPSAAASARS